PASRVASAEAVAPPAGPVPRVAPQEEAERRGGAGRPGGPGGPRGAAPQEGPAPPAGAPGAPKARGGAGGTAPRGAGSGAPRCSSAAGVNGFASRGTYNVLTLLMAAARPAPVDVSVATEARARWVGWVASARFGDKAAFAQLHSHFSGMVHAIVISRVNASDA